MIGNFFTKPLGGGVKFRRFRNIIMNCSFDEHGPVDVDEIMAVHRQKMENRILVTDTSKGNSDEPMIDKTSQTSNNIGSKECVGI